MMKEFWNERYNQEDFVYGELPNSYLKDKLSEIPVGRALFPADGEGRNSVYAAKNGWQVFAFDQSELGMAKAKRLADKHAVWIDFTVTDIENLAYTEASFDMIALIYAHFPATTRRVYHRKLARLLREDGTLILEGFAKSHSRNQQLNTRAGGPRDAEMLFDLEQLKADFGDFEWTEAHETTTDLSEGEYHQGRADLVRIFGTKKQKQVITKISASGHLNEKK